MGIKLRRTGGSRTVRPMIIALAGQKGGTGKSTIAVHLAAEWVRQGRSVLLVDADPQASALSWAETAAEAGVEAPHTIAMGDNLRKVLPKVAEPFEWTVIDCPGRKASKRQLGALMVSDLALLPCGPSTFDTWALSETLELVENVQEVREDLHAAIVVNRKTRSIEGQTARGVLAESGIPVLETEIAQRVAFSEALAAGKGVSVYAGGKAAGVEIRRLANEVEDFLLSKARADVA